MKEPISRSRACPARQDYREKGKHNLCPLRDYGTPPDFSPALWRRYDPARHSVLPLGVFTDWAMALTALGIDIQISTAYFADLRGDRSPSPLTVHFSELL